MAFDLEEQEQMENLKAFWERWGKLIMGLIFAGVVGILAWKGYGVYQVKQSEKASQAYDNYFTAVQKKDAGADALLTSLQKDYSKSRYAALASLDAAQIAMADKKWDVAQTHLQWLVDNGSVENQAVARLQLADVLAQMGKNDEAIKTLDALTAAEFTAAVANKKADVYLLMNDNAKARASVEAALKWVKEQPVKDETLERAITDKLELIPQ